VSPSAAPLAVEHRGARGPVRPLRDERPVGGACLSHYAVELGPGVLADLADRRRGLLSHDPAEVGGAERPDALPVPGDAGLLRVDLPSSRAIVSTVFWWSA
jgi:hypothetical protein